MTTMAKTINQIDASISELEQELNNLKSVIDYLNSAKSTVSNSIQISNKAVSELETKAQALKSTYNVYADLTEKTEELRNRIEGINFPERLTNIETSIANTTERLDSGYDNAIDRLHAASETLEKANIAGHLEKLNELTNKNIANNSEIVGKIEGLSLGSKIANFETRLTKRHGDLMTEIKNETYASISDLSDTIKSSRKELNQALTSIKLELTEANTAALQAILDGVNTCENRIKTSLEGVHNKIVNKLSAQQASQKSLEEQVTSLADKLHKNHQESKNKFNILLVVVAIGMILSIALLVITS